MRRIFLLSILAAAALAGAALYFSPGAVGAVRQFVAAHSPGAGPAAEQHEARGDRAVAVLTAVASEADFPIRRYATGFVSSPAVVNVSARISSQIVAQQVRDGQIVKAGDSLFTLDDRALRAALDRDKATLDKDQAMLASAGADKERAESLVAKQAGTKQAYDQALAAEKAAQATVAADQATIDNDQVQLGFATISAPISGRLGAVKVTPGNLVTIGNGSTGSTPLVTITQMDPLEATFDLPETDLPLLRKARAATPAAPVMLYLDGDTTPAATGALSFVDTTVDSASGTVQVKASVPNSDLTLWPGQYVNVMLDAGVMPDIISIPTVAVQPGQHGSFVYVVKADDTVDVRPVEVALVEGANSAIGKGLHSGERVVVEGQELLKQGSPVHEGSNAAAVAAPRDGKAGAGVAAGTVRR